MISPNHLALQEPQRLDPTAFVRSEGDPFTPAICRLQDGTAVRIRPLLFGDTTALWRFLQGLPSTDTLTAACLQTSIPLIAVRIGPCGEEEQMIGVGAVVPMRETCEASGLLLRVTPAFRGLGLGTFLGARLIGIARRLLAEHLHVQVSEGDTGMQSVCQRLGFRFTPSAASGYQEGRLNLHSPAVA